MVVLLPDSGRSYLSKVYNDEWMRANGLLADDRARSTRIATCSPTATTTTDRPPVVVARTTERVGDAIDDAAGYGISQLPVSEAAEGDDVVGLVGSISEKGLLDRAYRDPSVVERTVGEVMDPPLPIVEASATPRRGVRAAERRRAPWSRSAASGRPASSPSSTCSSTSRTTGVTAPRSLFEATPVRRPAAHR